MFKQLARAGALSFSFMGAASPAMAHGVIGDRFFPATITTDDPFAADELALPTITVFNRQTDYEFEWSKSIVPGVAISIGDGYAVQTPFAGPNASGFENLHITPMAELYKSAPSEFILTAGFIWDIGGTGSKSVANPYSTYTPEILFGKGFGDLPDSMALLRPIGFTGQIGLQIPGRGSESKSVSWGGALEYSLLYLQNDVRDQGFSKFVAHLTPVVEFSLNSPTDNGGGGTTGTINPGLFWSGQYIQLGAEVIVPVNKASGGSVGAIAQLHFYIDDIFPHSLGRPIFGGQK